MKKILVVGEKIESRRMLGFALKKTVPQQLEASNGVEALEAMLVHAPDIVLMNVRMPGEFSGYNICELIKSDYCKRDACVILMSEMDEAHDHAEARRVGANAFLIKPFRLSQLVEIIQNHGDAANDFLIKQYR
jgi:CheY-like chemotaxis protein